MNKYSNMNYFRNCLFYEPLDIECGGIDFGPRGKKLQWSNCLQSTEERSNDRFINCYDYRY